MLDTNDLGRCHTEEQHPSRLRGRSRAGALALALLAAGAVLATPAQARAENVSPTGKGIAGGALLGGEIVVFGEALFGVRSGTAYALGAAGGAVAGGVGGYFLEQSLDDGHVPSYLLAGGLALVIPALVIALDQTRFVPAPGAREDRPVTNAPPANPGQPGGSAVVGTPPAEAPATTPAPSGTTPPASTTPAPTTPPAPAPTGGGTTPPATGGGGAPLSLIDVETGLTGSGLRLGVPIPEVRPVFTVAQSKAFAVKNPGTEVRFPVVHVSF